MIKGVVWRQGFVTLLELFLEVRELLAEFRDLLAERFHFRFEEGDAGFVVGGSRSLTRSRG